MALYRHRDFVDFWSVHTEVCDVLLGNQALVQRLKGEHFDVAVVDFFFGECGHALAHHTLGTIHTHVTSAKCSDFWTPSNLP